MRASALVVAGAKLTAGGVALALGFRAVSDDDFARVVIAQGFARAPALDPTGTSWLPLPFWITGAAMALFGRDLVVARGVAIVLGVVASLALLAAARWLFRDPVKALVGALIAATFPWSARLGVATVPELPTAAAIVVALASTAPGWTARRRLLGAVALAAGCLSRYEPWMVAIPFAALTAWDAHRRGGADEAARRDRFRLMLAAVVALAAPAAWIAWNAHAHGDAFAFLARVAAYKKAIGAGASGLGGAAADYGLAFLVAEPELIAAFVVAGLAAYRFRASVPTDLAGLRRPAAIAAILAGMLIVAGMKDGAPTHHPERALLAPLLLVALATGALLVDLARGLQGPGRTWVALAIGVAVIAGTSPRRRFAITLLPRTDEVAIGELAGETMPKGEKALLEVVDYGHFAVLAGSGRPEAFVLDRELDPRKAGEGSSFGDEARVREKARAVGAAWVVKKGDDAREGDGACRGAWCLGRVEGVEGERGGW